MSRLLQIEDRLLENASQISQVERAYGQRPSRALQSSLKSLQKARKSLQAEFEEVAAVAQVEVLSYRIIEGNHRPTMSLLGQALDSFQNLYTSLHAAVESERPKNTGHLSPSELSASSLEFAYGDASSVGFVFTIPNDRLLFGATKLDEAMARIVTLVSASSIEDIRGFASRFGVAPVRAMYRLAAVLASAGAGVDVSWKKHESNRGSIVLQPAEVEALRGLIDQTSDLEINENLLPGILLGFDATSRSFKFGPDNSSVMRGTLSEDADIPAEVSIPRRYKARIRTQIRVRYTTEQSEVNHLLLSLS